jgi:3-oxoacyl-[acyl-carrier-protein] synthase III
MAGIRDIASFFTDKKVYARDLIANGSLDEKEIEYYNSIGIETIFDADGYLGYDLAKQAVLKLMAKSSLEGTDIDLIIYIQNRLPQYLMSSGTARLQYEIGAKNADGFALSDLGCTDMSMAIRLARDFLIANTQAEVILICYGNSPYSPSRFRFPVTINGDGGIALTITRTADNEILDLSIKLQGNYWDLFKVDYRDNLYINYKEICGNYRKYGFELALESKIRLLELNEAILSRNGLKKTGIQHFLLQNLSLRSYEFYETAFDIKLSKACQFNLRKYGHLGPADVILNYLTGLETGLFQKGDNVLVMNNSPVASWSNILIRV